MANIWKNRAANTSEPSTRKTESHVKALRRIERMMPVSSIAAGTANTKASVETPEIPDAAFNPPA